jgi:hypothetical protein
MMRGFLLLLVWLFATPCLRASDGTLEYQVKAVCVLNAARFVSWPAQAPSDREGPFVIGILGQNPFGSILEEVTKGETIRKRQIVVREVTLEQASTGCHVLFISRSLNSELAAVLQTLGKSSVLTISEIEGFATKGGMIALSLDKGGGIHFEVDPRAAKAAGLKIDSQFLAIAQIAN